MERRDELNPLERAVLGLSRAGVTIEGEQADRLHIHPDLVSRIRVDLTERNLLLPNGTVSPTFGPSDAEEFTRFLGLRLVHCFQSPFTGDVWPVGVTELRIATIEQEPGKAPAAVMGGRRLPVATVPLPQPRAGVPAPDITHLMFAAKAALGGTSMEVDDLDEDGPTHRRGRDDVEVHIEHADDSPQHSYILTALVGDPDGRTEPWRLVTRLGVESDAFARRDAVAARPQSSHVQDLLDRFELGGDRATVVQHRAYRAQLEAAAKAHLESELGTGILAESTISAEELQRMEEAYIASTEDAAHAADHHRQIFSAAQVALEDLLQRMITHHGVPQILADAIASRTVSSPGGRDILKETEEGLAARGVPIRSLPRERYRLRQAAAGVSGKASLRTLVAFSALASTVDRTHPWHALTDLDTVVVELDLVAKWRNAAGGVHATGERLGAEEAHRARDICLRTFRRFSTSQTAPKESHVVEEA
jgi:hypothetical protein